MRAQPFLNASVTSIIKERTRILLSATPTCDGYCYNELLLAPHIEKKKQENGADRFFLKRDHTPARARILLSATPTCDGYCYNELLSAPRIEKKKQENGADRFF